MQPDRGARAVLRLREIRDGALYAYEVGIDGKTLIGEVFCADTDGKILWTQKEELPEWLQKFLQATLRSIWRSKDQQAWPRRLTRWRPAPAKDTSS